MQRWSAPSLAYPRSMGLARQIKLAAASVAFGAVATTVTAVACSKWGTTRLQSRNVAMGKSDLDGLSISGEYNHVMVLREEGKASRFDYIDATHSTPGYCVITTAASGLRCQAGWPWLAMTALIDFRDCRNISPFGNSIHEAIWPANQLLPATTRFTRVSPLWRGFAADAAVLSLPLWGLAVGLSWMRRWRAAAVRPCTGCGYELSGLPSASRCPECGIPTG